MPFRSTLPAPAALAFALSLSLTPLATQAGWFGKSAPTPVTLAADTAPAALAGHFEATAVKPLGGLKKVAITGLKLVVIHESDATATQSAGFGETGGSARSTMVYTLKGVEAPALQAMADRAHADLLAAFAEAGVEVVPLASLLAQPGGERLAGEAGLGHVQPVEIGAHEALLVTPTDLPVRLPMGVIARGGAADTTQRAAGAAQTAGQVAALAGKGGGMLGGLGGLGGLGKMVAGFGNVAQAIGDAGPLNQLIASTGTALVDAVVVINFVDLKTNDRSWLDRATSGGTATVAGSVQPSVMAGETRMTVNAGSGGGTITLKAPLLIAGPAFTGTTDVTTTGDKAGMVGAALLSGAMALSGYGGGSTSSIRRVQADAGPEYPAVVGQGVRLTGQAMVAAATR